MKLTLTLLIVMLSLGSLALATGDNDGIFKEKAGSREFTGQMIVRPLQPEALQALGLQAAQITTRSHAAAARLDAVRIRYEAVVDEHIVRVPEGFNENSYAAHLMATGDYQYVEPDWLCFPIATPNDPYYNQQWHHPKIDCPQAWDTFTGSTAHIAAFVDTGVYKSHEDLSAHLVPGYNSKDRKTEAQGGNVSDVNGHGTIVAGCIGAIGNNGKGCAGVCWDVSLMPVRTTNSSSGSAYMSDLTHGALWAAQNGAKTISVSYSGVDSNSVQTTGASVKGYGGLLIWAAGNDGWNLNWFDHSDVIIAGATDQSDNKASFSNYGLAIDVMAPGVDILSTKNYGGYASASGTSFSAPLTNGLCALLWAYAPTATPSEIEGYLFNGCDYIGASSTYGHGRINADGSLQLVPGGGGNVIVDIKVDGQDYPPSVPSWQAVSITISLDPGSEAGVAHDWWIQAVKNFTTNYWWKLPGTWVQSGTPVRAYNGGLITLNNYVLANTTLPVGTYIITFAVDQMNNNYEGTFADSVTIQSY
jgi:hypothetical protein